VEEELQSLLTRIHTEGIEKAEAEASEIVSAAQSKARGIVATAEQQAAEILASAEREALVFEERSAHALDQTARDFLIGVEKGVESILSASVRDGVAESLTPDTMARMLVKLAEAYAAKGMRESRIEVLVSPQDEEEFVRQVMGSYRERLGPGIEIRPVKGLHRGFRVSFSDDTLYHDFSEEAIAASLSQLLKPPLREIVLQAGEAGVADSKVTTSAVHPPETQDE